MYCAFKEPLPFPRANVALSFVTVAGHSLGSLRLPPGRTASGLQPQGLEKTLTATAATHWEVPVTFFSLHPPYHAQTSPTAIWNAVVPFPSSLRVTVGHLIPYQVARTREGENHHRYHQLVRDVCPWLQACDIHFGGERSTAEISDFQPCCNFF